ncbi:uncharacterized protein LOC110101408 [Dendrobium catenatum]|uniref:uncharacterized protein LOC110101408 n=1 Tax=Dendrobium catenatum TaxID=906689 RepID=UPI0009F67459|nr:uncharacterized protein LOC110101408 [Dendrobium catenatum]
MSIADHLKQMNSSTSYTQYSVWKVAKINNGNNWAIPSTFDSHISSLIQSVSIDSLEEKHYWLGKQNPKFQDFRTTFYRNLDTVTWYKFVWHKKAALRYSIYAWLAFRGGLKTYDVLADRGIITHNTCSFCQCDLETLSHLFYECSYTFNVAKTLLPWLNSLMMRPNLHQVYDSIFEQGFNNHTRNFYLLTASATIYFLWRARNERIFGGIIECQATLIAKVRKAIILKSNGWNQH